MILSIYCYRDKKLGAYEVPFVNNLEKDRAAVAVSRAIAGLDSDKRAKMIDLDLYYLGEFDDKTGNIKLCEKEHIISLDSIIIREEEVEKNGKESNK